MESERSTEVVEYPIVGNPVHVANALATLSERGDLVGHSTSAGLPDGRIVVMVRALAPVAQSPPPPSPVRPWPVVGVALVLAFATGIVYAAVIALMWVHAHWPIVVGALAVLAALALKAAHYIGGGSGTKISGTFEGRVHR